MAEVRILYIATADGLVQLANPGKSDRWREIGRALPGQDVRAVAASPSDPLMAVACGAAGVDLTANGGASWERVVPQAAAALAFDGTGRVLAATERGELLASADGQAWTPAGGVGTPVVQLVPLRDAVVVTLGADGAVGELDGDAWRARDAKPGVRSIAAHNQLPNALFLVGASSLLTPHGSTPLDAEPTGAILQLLGTPPALLLGSQEAPLRSGDDGVTLQPVAGPHGVTALVSPQRAVDQVFAGTSSGELWYSADRGRTWAQLSSGFAAVRGLAFARAL